MSLRRLAQQLGREYKSVHSETSLLIQTSLIARTAEDGVRIVWDRIVTELDLAALGLNMVDRIDENPAWPDYWDQTIFRWAESNLRILEAHAYGSRVRNWSERHSRPALSDSDLDIGLVISEDGKENAYTHYFFSKSDWRDELSDLLNITVELQQIEVDNHMVTPELMQRTGRVIFKRV